MVLEHWWERPIAASYWKVNSLMLLNSPAAAKILNVNEDRKDRGYPTFD
jgi:hypothetical protein